MKHLEYKDTNNKAFKTYYDKFKKMVKSDLDGDGWFLLVNDFPFKDGDNLMFTAGEDIGKWKDKNLVSLYGKTNYIIGRCRKKGPVLSLLHFQEGDYIKQATESGLRKQLKEYFQGTGVSTRIFKSVKVSDPDPEVSATELEDDVLPVEEQATTTGLSIEVVAVPEPKPASVKEAIGKLVETAENLGVKGEKDFITLMTNFQKSVPSGPRMKVAIAKLNEYFGEIASQPLAVEDNSGDDEIARILDEAENEMDLLDKEIKSYETKVAQLEKGMDKLDQDRNKLLKKAAQNIDKYNDSLDDDSEKTRKVRFKLSKESMEILQTKVPALTKSIADTKTEWEKAIDHLIDITVKYEEIEITYETNLQKV